MRKFISVILALMLVLSTTVVAFSAYNVVDADAPTIEDALVADEYEDALAKVYFMMPNGKNGPVADDDVYVHHPEVLDPETGEVIEEAYDELVIEAGGKAPSWYNEFNEGADGNHYAGIYWWDAPASPAAWPGYKMEIDDVDNSVYYAEIPGDGNLTSAIFNNGVDGGTDSSLPIYYKAAQSIDNNMEGAYEGDYETLWGDTYNEFDFEGCIYVIDPNQVSINAFSGKQTCGGNWYYYYGNGCYGSYRTDADEFTSAEDCCLNPDHFNEEGEHVGYHEDEPTPTEAPTEAPEPTEAPTEAPVPTEAPTEAPVPTEAPTEAPEPTEAPTEAPVPTEEPADTFIVAGNDTTIFGTSWNGNDTNNTMTFANDVWYKEYTVDGAINAVQLKAVKNGTAWIGDATGNNVTFNVTEAGTFTVYCDGTKTWVEGDNVMPISELNVQSVTVVGNGSPDGDNWLNKINWDPAAEANHMTKVGDTAVYEIEYTLGEFDPTDIEFKFAINDAWTDNFGLADGGKIENGVETDAVYNGSTNLKITGLTAGTTIKMQLDLTDFNYDSKTGAKMTVTWGSDAPSYILGDANGDGVVDSIDATLIQRYDAQMHVGDSFDVNAADVNGDGEVDILDVTFIQRYLAGMNVKFPIGEPANVA